MDWKLIETHWPDLMRVALSVRAGRISSVTLLRRLGSESRRNRIYRALREVGRAVRTIVLLRYLSEPQLREGITAVTNRVEAVRGFAGWLLSGREILAHNDPVHHEKTVKFNELLASSAMYSTALDLMAEISALIAAGRPAGPDDLAVVTPVITSKIRRSQDWKLDLTPPASGPVGLDLPIQPAARTPRVGMTRRARPAVGGVRLACPAWS